jgi:hypothetical protein
MCRDHHANAALLRLLVLQAIQLYSLGVRQQQGVTTPERRQAARTTTVRCHINTPQSISERTALVLCILQCKTAAQVQAVATLHSVHDL